MPVFKDSAGREWIIRIDAPKIREVRNDCQIDLAGIDGKAFDKLQDVCLLVDVLWVLCRGQNHGVDAEAFGSSLVGDPIEHATAALVEAVTDFFPTRTRSLLRSLTEKQAAIETKATELILAKVNDPTIEARILAETEKRLTAELEKVLTGLSSATSSPASVESAPKA
jgi:hypothetical protein